MFVLMHCALTVDGMPQEWRMAVVPRAGTGESAGPGGAMTITITDGRHSYDLAFTPPGH